MLRRDGRAGELHLLAAAILIAVAALCAVGFFADRVRQALENEAQQLLGADLLLLADHPWPAGVSEEAGRHGLAVTETRTFPSMISFGEGEAARAQLVEIKAVAPGYPLRGRLRVAAAPNSADRPAEGIPSPGGAWIDERLAGSLGARVGDSMLLGGRRLRVDAILTLEPDRGVNFFSVAPRLLMNLADLDSTGLVQPGSRIGHRLLLAGEAEAVRRFRASRQAALGPGERIEDVQNGRPEIRTALERAQRFLGLSALLTVVLAAVAVALAARRYTLRRLDACAVMRCLGATQGMLLRLHLVQFALLALIASLLGCLLGYLAHFALNAWLAPLLAAPLPPPGLLPAVQGGAVGILLLFGFAVPPLMQLKRVPTLRVLRRELAGAPPGWLGGYLAGTFGLVGLMLWTAGDLRLGAYVVGGFAAALLFFAAAARVAVRLAAALRHGPGSGVGWRYGLAGLQRRAGASTLQIVSLGLGFMALLLLTVTRGDLLDAWARAIPPDAPNRFVINIQPAQVEAVRALFAANGLPAELAPMVRGRLSAINGREVSAGSYEDEQARRLVEREFNLSWRADLPAGNQLTAGRWFAGNERGKGLASVEGGLARTLGLGVGDTMEFSLAGERLSLQVVGLRKLDWDSMRVNFFVLTPPAVLEAYPASWITSFHLPAAQADFVNRLVREFPNLTVVDVGAIVRQLRSIMEQVARAVQFVFLFTLLAGLVVLYTALASAAEERRYEIALMRALGARRAQLRAALLTEFAAVGALAGLIAALGALAVGQLLARRAFQFEVAIDFSIVPMAMLGGAVLVCTAGWLAAARLMRSPPMAVLRAGD